jgi:hypothetical protein
MGGGVKHESESAGCWSGGLIGDGVIDCEAVSVGIGPHDDRVLDARLRAPVRLALQGLGPLERAAIFRMCS